jgi:hypothetical protein
MWFLVSAAGGIHLGDNPEIANRRTAANLCNKPNARHKGPQALIVRIWAIL